MAQQIPGDPPRGGGWAVRSTAGFAITEATAWVVRAMAHPATHPAGISASLELGVRWLESNQNDDGGWGSYLGQSSRVFLTALSLLALSEAGADPSRLQKACQWLLAARTADSTAWGALPNAEPTILHTSIVILALSAHDSNSSQSVIQNAATWIAHHFDPNLLTEKSSTNEEYAFKYSAGGAQVDFSNSLPHFATPIAVAALLKAGRNPFDTNLFTAARTLIDGQLDAGNWELPRNPMRASIWAIWPFVYSLSAFRAAACPNPGSDVSLLLPGCSITHSGDTRAEITRRILLSSALVQWLRAHRLALTLWCLSVALAVVPITLYFTHALTLNAALLSLILPALLVAIQMTLDVRRRARQAVYEQDAADG
jgi:hypothetical protein